MKSLLKLLLFFICFYSYSQVTTVTKTIERKESIKPLRLGVRLGTPSLLTGNLEYVTPLLDNRVAATLDYMSLSQTIDEVSLKYSNFEIGTNVYLTEKGKGLYASLTYFSFKSNGDYGDTHFDDGSYSDGKAQIDFNTINFKVGVKLGRVFYFRTELGYGFGKIPEKILVKSLSSNATTLVDIPAIPGIGPSGTLIFNIGIGFGFL